MRGWRVAMLMVVVITVLLRLDATAQAGCDTALPTLYQQVSPAVVFISAVSIASVHPGERAGTVIGSGVLIDREGLILTNSHVVFGRRAVSVTLDSGYTTPAKVLGADPILDVAVLRIPLPEAGLPKATLGDSDALQVGEEVIAIGNPMGLEQTLTRGVISGIDRLLWEFPLNLMLPLIQTDAAINPGNSGGPLVNRCGEVVGLTSALLADAKNIGFAIPINVVKQVLPQLVQQGRVMRPWLGVSGKVIGKEVQDLLKLPLVDGFLVETIEPGSPAAKAGLHEGELLLAISGEEFLFGGDIITAANGKELDDTEKFAQFVRTLKVGETVRLTLYHDGTTRQVEFTLPERPILPGDVPPDGRRALAPLGHRRAPLQLQR
jgi:S1-C subfamily serine protease